MSFTLTECHVIIVDPVSDRHSPAILAVILRLETASAIDGPHWEADDSAQNRFGPLGRIVRFCNR